MSIPSDPRISLPMYDVPELSAHTDAFARGLARHVEQELQSSCARAGLGEAECCHET